jgi:hypothetical protein
VKDHNSIVLRAENVGTKYEWISRMMRAVAASAGPPPPPPVQVQAQPAADPRRASKGGQCFRLGVALWHLNFACISVAVTVRLRSTALLGTCRVCARTLVHPA